MDKYGGCVREWDCVGVLVLVLGWVCEWGWSRVRLDSALCTVTPGISGTPAERR